MGQGQLRTVGQNRALWGAVQQLAQVSGCSRQDAEVALRAICQQVAGHDHTSRLTTGQADLVLERLRARVDAAQDSRPVPAPTPTAGPVSTRTGQAPTRDRLPITERQQEVLAALYRQVGWEERHKQMAFAKRQCKVPWPQTQWHADQIMEPLKAIALRHTDPRDAWQRAQALVDHRGLDAWQRQFIPDLVRQFESAGDISTVLSPHKLLKLIEAEVAVARSAA